ncbi:hypothetical protein SAMN04487970_1017102 [Paenibacillus tianmuensis]|uniref:Oxidoreductase family, NAD-binding Rossmann fold n=1 Tax=Paenibacillus tianmuensis TaxID=624147 RepID=A0A1G4RPB2_9BACL|nr:hypothetical protein [Paenibacillus tianmuensis]SCW58626.1 hypothetical protein SAMN04487970_1017102 [Paenibacillus tianmuensis]
MKRIAVSVIDAGNMGIHHVRNYHYLQPVDLVGVVDKDPFKLQEIEKYFSVLIYTKFGNKVKKHN